MFLQQLVTGISVGGIYALLATGYSLIYSLLDFSNWAHGEFAMVSAYTLLSFCPALWECPLFSPPLAAWQAARW